MKNSSTRTRAFQDLHSLLPQFLRCIEVLVIGILIQRRIVTTKKGDKMAYGVLEDLTANLEIIVFPELYKSRSQLLTTDTPLLITGNLDKSEKGLRLKATKIESFSQRKTTMASKVEISIDADRIQKDDLHQLRITLGKFSGKCNVFLKLSSLKEGNSLIAVPQEFRITPSPLFISEVEEAMGKGTVSIH